jgi:redox-sensitive bicupin YhaK (pirin superfamily)
VSSIPSSPTVGEAEQVRPPWWRRILRLHGRGRTGPVSGLDAPLPRIEGHEERSRTLRFHSHGDLVDQADGVETLRFIGSARLDMADPFLMVEYFRAGPANERLGAFAEQPVLGMEVLTYLVEGSLHHRDNQGFAGTIPAGGVQWLAATSGLLRTETPEPAGGRFSGVRLWLAMPRAQRRAAPASFPETGSNVLPVEHRDRHRLRLVSGTTSRGLTGPVIGRPGDPLIADITLEAGALLEEPIGGGFTVVLMVLEGEIGLPPTSSDPSPVVKARELAVLDDGDLVMAVAGSEGARLLLAAARPLGEPVARGGSIVMSSRKELLDAVRDYRQGRL